MCGIVGYVGKREVVPVLLQGLESLEYRGYDSSGLAYFDKAQKKIDCFKAAGPVARLKSQLTHIHHSGSIGIAHTRWATHGAPTQENAHPHLDNKGHFAIVHNGIIENYKLLKQDLEKRGYEFKSQTDTETAVHLWHSQSRNGNPIRDSFRRAILNMEGHFAFVGIGLDEPDRLFVFRRSNPLLIGLGRGENFVASDATAFLPYTNKVIYLGDDELAEVFKDHVRIYNLKTGKLIHKKSVQIDWSKEQAQKGNFPHFMLKEIHEQPEVIKETLKQHVKRNQIIWGELGRQDLDKFKRVERIFAVSCGTAYHACLASKYMFDSCTGIPVSVDVSSEFRYSEQKLNRKDMVLLVSQSGETADTLAALNEAKRQGAFTLAIVNVRGSTLAREADAVIYTHAGPEIGVASTKAYTAQLIILALFTIYLGVIRNKISKKDAAIFLKEAVKLPKYCSEIIQKKSEMVKGYAGVLKDKPNFIYLGRGINFPTALEGALKFKEITYTHAHGYAAGEMKHGPIALIDDRLVVICIAPQSKTYEKMMSNIEEVSARKGIVFSIGTEGDQKLIEKSRFFIGVPRVPEIFSPILTVIPLQLLAYYVAVAKGNNVDKPRNLAKSVTVE